jgi:hypothetical protein
VGAQGAWSNQLVNLLVIAAQKAGYSGLFVYSPAPGAGNLILSIAAVPGTDPYGNAYRPILVAGLASGPQVQITTSSADAAGVEEAQVEFPTNSAIEAAAGHILSAVLGSGSAAYATLIIDGPEAVAQGDRVIIAMSSSNAGPTSTANGQFIYEAADGTQTVTASFSVAGWTITVEYMTGPNGNPVFGWSQWSGSPAGPGSAAGAPPSSGGTSAGSFTGSALSYMQALETDFNATVAAVSDHESRLAYLYAVLQDSGIIAGG